MTSRPTAAKGADERYLGAPYVMIGGLWHRVTAGSLTAWGHRTVKITPLRGQG